MLGDGTALREADDPFGVNEEALWYAAHAVVDGRSTRVVHDVRPAAITVTGKELTSVIDGVLVEDADDGEAITVPLLRLDEHAVLVDALETPTRPEVHQHRSAAILAERHHAAFGAEELEGRSSSTDKWGGDLAWIASESLQQEPGDRDH